MEPKSNSVAMSAIWTVVQAQVFMEFQSGTQALDNLRGWKLKITCTHAAIGRLDSWMAGDRLARFRDHPLVETARTIGMPATSNDVIAVACYASKHKWKSDLGDQQVPAAIVARSSSFSSRGPTRDGRQKPEISAPGEMITAALAVPSESAGDRGRADNAARLLTIEGTSMATPFVAGVVALMLERNGALAPADIARIFKNCAVKDEHTGPSDWTPEYGHGKLSAEQVLDAVGGGALPAAVVVGALGAGPAGAKPRRPKKKAKTTT
jgi:subtilisin family serine protease